jgi:hypothetical protein
VILLAFGLAAVATASYIRNPYTNTLDYYQSGNEIFSTVNGCAPGIVKEVLVLAIGFLLVLSGIDWIIIIGGHRK